MARPKQQVARSIEQDEADPKKINYRLAPGETPAAACARLITDPTVNSAIAVNAFRPAGLETVPLGRLIDSLTDQCDAVAKNDSTQAERMLTTQAHALDAIFSRLAAHSSNFIGTEVHLAESYLKLALRAQNQCRTTLEALAAVKNPHSVYVRQQNIAHNQQVNNGQGPARRADAAETENAPNELLEVEHGERLDARASGQAGCGDPSMEAVGAVHGPAKREREKPV